MAVSEVTKKAFSGIDIPVLSDIPVLGPLLFRYNWVVYFAIAAALFMTWFFNRTRVGLNLRAVGEDPATADAAGINTTVYKYMATVIGGGICGIGGMYMSMVTTSGVWVHNCVSGYGWLAVALVILQHGVLQEECLWRLYSAVLRSCVCILIFPDFRLRFMICSRTLLRYLFL